MNNQIIKSKSINKIIVVGHPLSGYQEVEALLNISGMNLAKPSRRDEFSPVEIGAMLCKSHQAPTFTTLGANAAIEQTDVSPVWNGMALDLLLGNIDQLLWGWADSQSVYLLDYWKGLDPRIAFILVYDTPQQLVAQAFDEQTPLSPEALQQATDNWSTYNAALLHFYHRNSERCLLVHAQEVRASAGAYLQQVRTRIGAPVLTVGTDTDETDADADTSAATDEIIAAAPHNAAVSEQGKLKAYLAHALVQSDTMQLYEELQSVANLPLSDIAAAPCTPLDAWISMTAQQVQHTKQAAKTQAHAHTQEVQIGVLSQSLSDANALAGEKQQQIASLEQTRTTAQQHAQDQQRESELILLQLHQVQEELERHYLEGQQQKEKIKVLQETEKLTSEQAKNIEQLSQDKAKLSKELAAQIKTIAAKPLTPVNPEMQQENDLLLLQLHQVQEELERYYLENQKLKRSPAIPAKPPKTALYGAAERVKRQLSYRLGATMIAQSRSFTGCLTMPSALLKQVRQFKSEQKTQGDVKMPPIKNYADAHDADRVKQHLSYRLGAVMVTHAKSPLGWLKMPWALRCAALDFKRSRGVA